MSNRRVVDFSGLVEMGIRYTARHLRRLVKAGEFPTPFKLGKGRNYWWLDEIEAHFAACIKERDE
jgi:predicted DNA-binding transcriptional regulator AlpA